jgi:IclR family mhp operon transcriptional activator
MPKSQTVRGLQRGLQVLRVLQSGEASSLHDIHVATTISKASLLRILATLEQEGVVARRLADGRYRLGTSLPRGRRDRHARLAEAAGPVLRRLCRDVSWPSDLLVPMGGHLEILETSRPHSPFVIHLPSIGVKVGYVMSAVGRAYLAFCPDDERAAVLRRLRGSARPDDRLARDPKRLERILDETRQRGYGMRGPHFSGGPYGTAPLHDGLAAIAVPLRGGGKIHGVINLLWIQTAFTAEQFAAQHLSRLEAAAADIVGGMTSARARTHKNGCIV